MYLLMACLKILTQIQSTDVGTEKRGAGQLVEPLDMNGSMWRKTMMKIQTLGTLGLKGSEGSQEEWKSVH